MAPSAQALLVADAVDAGDVDHPNQAIADLTGVTGFDDGAADGLDHLIIHEHADHQLVGEVGQLIFDRALVHRGRGSETFGLEDGHTRKVGDGPQGITQALQVLEAPTSFEPLLKPFDALIEGQIAAMGPAVLPPSPRGTVQ